MPELPGEGARLPGPSGLSPRARGGELAPQARRGPWPPQDPATLLFPKVRKSFLARQPPWERIEGAALAFLEPEVTAPVLLATSSCTVSETTSTPSVGSASDTSWTTPSPRGCIAEVQGGLWPQGPPPWAPVLQLQPSARCVCRAFPTGEGGTSVSTQASASCPRRRALPGWPVT